MIASSPAPHRHLVSSLETADPCAPGTLLIEELPIVTGSPRPALPPIIEVDRIDLSALARRRGLGAYLAAAARRR